MKKLALVGLAGALAAVGIAAPSFAGGNKYGDDPVSQVCKTMAGTDAGTILLDGPSKLWPPNHKFIPEPVTVTAADASGNDVSVTLYPEAADEIGGDGGSEHDPDAQMTDGTQNFTAADTDGTATAALQMRAERSGKGDGRTYTINWMASFGPTTCDSRSSQTDSYVPFLISVPHDMRGGADWK